jgi:hypothetical protein
MATMKVPNDDHGAGQGATIPSEGFTHTTAKGGCVGHRFGGFLTQGLENGSGDRLRTVEAIAEYCRRPFHGHLFWDRFDSDRFDDDRRPAVLIGSVHSALLLVVVAHFDNFD